MIPVRYLKFTVAAMLMAIVPAACAQWSQTASPGGEAASSEFFDGLIAFYTGPLNHLEGVRRGSCPMYPSCSRYTRQAVARHGFIKGWIMAADRLMRCGRDELEIAPKVFAHGAWRHYDPLERNEWSTSPLSERRLHVHKAPELSASGHLHLDQQ